MFSRTVSHGKTPFSWKTKMRRGSGSRTAWPSTSASPRVWWRKPPMMLSRVDLPQPDGPTMQTNSPSRTSRSMRSSTWICSPDGFPGKLIQRSRTEIAVFILVLAISPFHFVKFFQPPHDEVENQSDQTDHHHAGDD